MLNINVLKTYLKSKNSVFIESKDAIELNLKVIAKSGHRHLFKLLISEMPNNLLRVKEISGVLPSFCPNRHINSDGSFCLGIQTDTEKLSIKDVEKHFGKKVKVCPAHRNPDLIINAMVEENGTKFLDRRKSLRGNTYRCFLFN